MRNAADAAADAAGLADSTDPPRRGPFAAARRGGDRRVLGRGRASRRPDVYAPRPAEEVRGQVMRWLSQHGLQSAKTAPRIAELWAAGGGAAPGREVFERLIQSFCLADPDTRRFVEACSLALPLKAFPTQEFLSRDESDEFYTIHLRLFYARALTQRLMYDEALGGLRADRPGPRGRSGDLPVLSGRLPAPIAQENGRIGDARQAVAQDRRSCRIVLRGWAP